MAEGEWPDLAGKLDADDGGRFHRLPIRVYFEDTDFSGVVYHASYVHWCERGRSDFLRLLGNDHNQILGGADGREPSAFVVRRMSLEFLRPTRIDDILEVQTRVADIGAATLTLDQVVSCQGNPVFSAEVLVVLVSLSGKPQRLSQHIRQALSS